MAKIIAFHSFRRGTGKSNIVASVAAQLSATGARVGVVDTNLQSSSAHILFNLDTNNILFTINDYLWEDCMLEQIVYDVTPPKYPFSNGKIYLIPASPNINQMVKVLREGFEISRMNGVFSEFISAYHLDVLLIDSPAGISQETMVSQAIADTLVVIMRLDRQDFDGTAVILTLAERLGLENVLLVINNFPATFDPEKARQDIESAYAREVNLILPHCEELMTLASGGIIAIRYPEHPFSKALGNLAQQVIE